MREEQSRMIEIYTLGFMPFAQLYRNDSGKKYSKEWRNFQRTWARPAAYKTLLKGK
jgi:hypothetical protein